MSNEPSECPAGNEPAEHTIIVDANTSGVLDIRMHPFFNRDPKTAASSNTVLALEKTHILPPENVAEDGEGKTTVKTKKRGRPKKSGQASAQIFNLPGQETDSGDNGAASALEGCQISKAKPSGRSKNADKNQRRLNFITSNPVPSPPLSPDLSAREEQDALAEPTQDPTIFSPQATNDHAAQNLDEHPSNDVLTPESGQISSNMFDIVPQASPCQGLSRPRSRSASLSNVTEPPRKKHRTSGSLKQMTMSTMFGSSGPHELQHKPSLIVKLKVNVPPPAPRPSLTVKLAVRVPPSLLEKPKKPIHPFFSKGHAKPPKPEASNSSSSSETTSGNVPSNETLNDASSSSRSLPFGSSFRPKPKWVVYVDPPWPPAGAVHIRGLPSQTDEHAPVDVDALVRTSKGKEKQFQFPESESVLRLMYDRLSSAAENALHSPSSELSPFLRIPERVELTATPLLKQHLRSVLYTGLSSPNLHAALKRLREIMADCETVTTQFDKAEPQTVAWTAKYAPTRTAEVLQAGKEPSILSEWLKSMKVWSVETANAGSSTVKKSDAKRKKEKKKRRKKRQEELDGFVVSESEDEETMDELTDPEDHVGPAVGAKRPVSLVRRPPARLENPFDRDDDDDSIGSRHSRSRVSSSSREASPQARPYNAIVISGPSGAGKTAAVWAAAQEHGFAVFEVHPGQKRGNRELLELVGDMTKNHLVHKMTNLEVTEDAPNILGNTLQLKTINEDKSKSQSQSLILIEEADILFEEDKGFWQAVDSLISESKRPVIITCNDETRLPMEDLELHAVLRFSLPPKHLVVDYLLMLSAAEGHLLPRATIETLHDQCNGDLRMAIMQLNFWCQMAVGDRTGGMKWLVKRWPEGIDMEDGEIIRCFSRDTFLPGMGQFNRELLPSTAETVTGRPVHSEDDSWLDVLENTGLHVGMSLFDDVESIATAMRNNDNQMALARYDSFVDAYSAVDVLAGKDLKHEDLNHYGTAYTPQHEQYNANNVLGHPFQQDEQLVFSTSTYGLLSTHITYSAWNILKDQSRTGPAPSYGCNFTEPELANVIRTNSIVYPATAKLSHECLLSPFQEDLLPSENFFPLPNPGLYQFHQPLSVLTTDICPFVRGIARTDLAREEARREMLKETGNLLSVGGRGRIRSTRTSKSRAQETYLRGNMRDILESAGEGWEAAVQTDLEAQAASATPPPPPENSIADLAMDTTPHPEHTESKQQLNDNKDDLDGDNEMTDPV